MPCTRTRYWQNYGEAPSSADCSRQQKSVRTSFWRIETRFQFNPGGLPLKLEEIISKCLEKDRNLRYQHAADIRTDLQRLKRDTDSNQSGATQARAGTQAAAAQTRSVALGRSTWMVVAAVVVVAALAAGGYLALHRPTAKLTDKDTIVLADFANSTGDSVFDDTLKTALSVSLNQSPFLNVLPDSEVTKTLQLMNRPADTKLIPEVVRELCLRTGSKLYPERSPIWAANMSWDSRP